MIHVIATIALHPGTRERFLTAFDRLVPEVRAEAGCLEYGGAVDTPTAIASQIPLRSDVVTVIERWTDVSALSRHLEAPHMEAYRARVASYVTSVDLQILSPVEPSATGVRPS